MGSRGSIESGDMHTPREDAAGAVVGDGAVPAARAIEAVPCSPTGAVDLRDSRHPKADPLHFSAAEWAEFLAAVKAGRYDAVAI
jgi:hypothetical protein